TGNFYNIDYAYNRIPNELDPADYDEFMASPMRFHSVIANMETGKAEYYHITDMRKEMNWLRASASLPLLSTPVVLDSKKYLDGGISDSIPLERSIADGNTKHVVILTQHRGFVKKPNSNKYLTRLVYRKYPNFVHAMEDRHNMYNRETEFVYEKEKEGSVFVIQPEKPVEIARLEKDKSKLKRLYQQGYDQAAACYESLMEFLEK
ncbi:MAG: patatin family protein, partial [Oscillospiraceae bacterium]|nr:patatin family protein [Oscillospiraceae bacterium]